MKKIIVIVLFMFMFGVSFWKTDFTHTISETVSAFLNILNIIWIPFAILAGKLFTNDFVYGSFMHLDVILRKIWNFSKTIANYALAFILIISIFGLFIWKTKNIFSVLAKIWLAAILINFSWFLLWALVDISTILLVAVGNFPMQMIGQTTIVKPQVEYCNTLTVKASKDVNEILVCKNKDKINAGEFLQKANWLAWPLVYIWEAILWINKSWSQTDVVKEKNPSGKDVLKAISVWMMIQLVAILLFVVPIFILFVIGLIRIFRLWIYIWFSPLIILDQIFWWKMLQNKKEFQLKNIIWLIFQPVLVVFAMWIAVIFLVSIQSAFLSKKVNKWLEELWVCKNDKNALCVTDETWKSKPAVKIVWDFMKEFVKDTGGAFGYLILFILTTLVLWSMIKVATKSSEITASVSENIYKFAEESLKAVPFIPTPFGRVGVWALEMALERKILKSDFQTKAAEQADALLNALGIKPNDISVSEKTKFAKEIAEVRSFNSWKETFMTQLRQIASKHSNLIPAYAPNFQEEIYNALDVLYKKTKTGNFHLTKSVVEHILEEIWFLKKKDWKVQKVSKEQLFANPKFQTFLTWLFMHLDDSSLSGVSDFATFYTNVMAGAQALTTKPISEIVWKKSQ